MSFPPHRRFVNHLCGGFLFKSLLSLFICACLYASKPLLFHSTIPSKPYKPSLFLNDFSLIPQSYPDPFSKTLIANSGRPEH